MRAFVAVDISDESVLDALVAFQSALRKTGADIKLVERENLHFTIKFLGDISDEDSSEVDRRLKALDLKAFDATLRGVGAFPGTNRPRVVWAGLAPAEAERLSLLGKAVIDSLKGVGEEDRRGFEPHLTLARVRSGRNLAQLSVLLKDSQAVSFGTVRADSLKLKSSVLKPSGPVYSDVGVYPLA